MEGKRWGEGRGGERDGGEKGIYWTLDVNVNVDIDIGTYEVDSRQWTVL